MKIIKILNYIFPLIIGALCSYMGSLTHIGKNNIADYYDFYIKCHFFYFIIL